MHRTRTTAKALAAVAVAVVSGCVSVEPRPAPAPSVPQGARPAQGTAPRIVEAPAREALETVPPPPPARPTPAGGAWREPPAPATPRSEPPRPSRPRVPPPERERPRARVPGPRPPAPPPAPVTTQDVCALGERYGGWHPDSPEAVICRNAYGR